jgi:hypothetical protein
MQQKARTVRLESGRGCILDATTDGISEPTLKGSLGASPKSVNVQQLVNSIGSELEVYCTQSQAKLKHKVR